MNKFCIACGTALEPNTKFCAQCGKEIKLEGEGLDSTSGALFSSDEIKQISGLSAVATPHALEGKVEKIPAPNPAPIASETKRTPPPAPKVSAPRLEPEMQEVRSKKGFIVGGIIGLAVIIGALVWVPYAQEQREYEIAQAEEARLERQAAEKAKQEKIALEKQKQAEILSAFEAAKASNRITTLGEFVKKYPDSSYVEEAERLAYASLKRQNSSKALSAFQKWFPTGEVSALETVTEDDLKTNDGVAETTKWNGPFDDFGKPHGTGYARFPSGATFEGRLEHGERVYGTETEVDGSSYTGPFKGYHPHGKGVQVLTDGVRYEGDFVLGYMQGKGVLTSPDGYKYEGEFSKGNIEGFGVERLQDGTVYKGRQKDGEYDGEGKLTLPDGESYEGSFVKGNFHGKGTLKKAGGVSYVGDWLNSTMNGQGILSFGNGGYYKGSFIDGKQMGRGVHVDAEGNKYEGEFLNNEFHGTGVVYFTDGTQENVTYDNGERID